jgi:hypothetical protein
MGRRAKAGTVLPELVELALPMLQEAERQFPRTGPGAKPDIPDWVMAAMIMIALLSKKKTKSAQYRFLSERRRDIGTWLGYSRFPSRATYFRRYCRTHRLYREAIRLQGQQAIAEGIADPDLVAADKSMIEGQGPDWHAQDRRSGATPAGVDIDTTWGYSKHDGWVQGYSFEVVVTATPGSVVFPLLASVDTASVSETRTFDDKIDLLPEGVKRVLADSGYDTNHLGERVEFDGQGERSGRRFVCPPNPRNNKRKKTKPGGADASRARSRQLREQRIKYYRSRRGRQQYARRRKTVEPFNQWLKSLFELEGRVWHRGLDNNQTQIMGSIFVYQLLVRYNHCCGKENGRIRWILDTM